MSPPQTALIRIAQIHRNLKSVGTVGTVGTASNYGACRRSHPIKEVGTGGNTHLFEHKSQSQPFVLVITVPTKKGVGTKAALSDPLEASPFGAVHTVPTVPTLFGISGTFVCGCSVGVRP